MENESIADFWKVPQIMTANWSEDADTLMIDTKITFNQAGETNESLTWEKWILQEDGSILGIKLKSKSQWGERNVKLVFN